MSYTSDDDDFSWDGERLDRIIQFAQSTACPASLQSRLQSVADDLEDSYEECDTSNLLATCKRAVELCEALDIEAATTQRMSTRSRTTATKQGLEPPPKRYRMNASELSSTKPASMPEDISYVAIATEVANAAAFALDHNCTELDHAYTDYDSYEDVHHEIDLRLEWDQVFSILQHPAFDNNRHPDLQAALLRCLKSIMSASDTMFCIKVNMGLHHDGRVLEQLRAKPHQEQQLIILIQQAGIAPAALSAASLALLQATRGNISRHHEATMAAALHAALLASSADEEHVSDIAKCLTQCCSRQSPGVWQVLQPQVPALLHHLLHILKKLDPDQYNIKERAGHIMDVMVIIMRQLSRSNDDSTAMQALLKLAEQQMIRTAVHLDGYTGMMLFTYLLGSSTALEELASLAAGVCSMQQVRDAARGDWKIMFVRRCLLKCHVAASPCSVHQQLFATNQSSPHSMITMSSDADLADVLLVCHHA
jgi:hypothetical protein